MIKEAASKAKLQKILKSSKILRFCVSCTYAIWNITYHIFEGHIFVKYITTVLVVLIIQETYLHNEGGNFAMHNNIFSNVTMTWLYAIAVRQFKIAQALKQNFASDVT